MAVAMPEPAVALWAVGIGGGLCANAVLFRSRRRLLCQVARNRVGFALYLAFGLHLFVRPLDLVHLIANLYRRLT